MPKRKKKKTEEDTLQLLKVPMKWKGKTVHVLFLNGEWTKGGTGHHMLPIACDRKFKHTHEAAVFIEKLVQENASMKFRVEDTEVHWKDLPLFVGWGTLSPIFTKLLTEGRPK